MLNSFRKERLLDAKNYALFYGHGNVKELSRFDVAIVDPNGLKLPEYEQLRLSNTIVITYVSLIEVHPTEPIFKELSLSDFITAGGKPLKNELFGNYLVSLQSKKWIQYLLKKINHHFNVIESDGIFLDTIGDLEMGMLPGQIQQKQLSAAANFLSAVKMLYPHYLLIQNNGLEKVVQSTAPFIDGVCWENPPFTLKECQEWVEAKIKQLSGLKVKHNLKIFLLLEETLEKERKAIDHVRKVAKKEDFLLYHASKNYVEGVNIIKG